jgi:hypothetical protein
MAVFRKEIKMRAHGQTMVWGTHIGVGHAHDTVSWYQQLKAWWQARKTAHEQARHHALTACWDAKHETVRPFRAEAAAEMVAAQHAVSVSTMLYGLSQ